MAIKPIVGVSFSSGQAQIDDVRPIANWITNADYRVQKFRKMVVLDISMALGKVLPGLIFLLTEGIPSPHNQATAHPQSPSQAPVSLRGSPPQDPHADAHRFQATMYQQHEDAMSFMHDWRTSERRSPGWHEEKDMGYSVDSVDGRSGGPK
ncbi:MAG: hypothetical protein Q9202_006679 [Teloschistes flavicans]